MRRENFECVLAILAESKWWELVKSTDWMSVVMKAEEWVVMSADVWVVRTEPTKESPSAVK